MGKAQLVGAGARVFSGVCNSCTEAVMEQNAVTQSFVLDGKIWQAVPKIYFPELRGVKQTV